MRGDGTPGDLGNDITLDWSAVSPPARFSGQHCAHLMHDGRLMLLDNDNGRALAVTIDETTMTGTVDAEFPTHEDQCFPQGTAMDSTAGNVLAACWTDWVREYDPTGLMLWEAQLQCRSSGGFGANSAARWYPLDTWE